QRAYGKWVRENKISLNDIEVPPGGQAFREEPRQKRQRIFGYTLEDLRLLMAPMAKAGEEPVGSMGTDTPLAVLSDRPQLLFNYFKQHFAQVTNPAIDPQREALSMSLRTAIGQHPNLLDE